jgi:hypothetical protein
VKDQLTDAIHDALVELGTNDPLLSNFQLAEAISDRFQFWSTVSDNEVGEVHLWWIP